MKQRQGPNDHTRRKPLTSRAPVPRRGGNDQTSVGQGSGSGSGNAQAISSDAGPAMFDSATNTMINDGHFTTHQGDHTSVTININGPRIPRTSGDIQNQSSTQNAASNTDTNSNRIRSRRPNRPEENMIRPVRRSREIYERHLMLEGRGFPLWIPQPNIRLPIPYRAKGVCIGDVGIITNFGGFDFLFNICRARDDPINPEELPDNFTPIHPPLNPIDVREFQEFSSGSYLASSSIVKSQTTEQTPGLTFESSASEGAILTMPEGAFQEELSNISKFRNYIALHATDWYKFVNGPRGREAQNGDVRVVVGCDKTTTWGMAAFGNTSSAQQSKFRLKFRPLGGQQQPQHNAGGVYAWDHSGVAEVRVGPEPGGDEELSATQTAQLRNQCLFMRTLSATLSDTVWAATFPETVSSINQEGSQPEHRDQNLCPPNPNTARSHPSSSKPARFVQGTRRSLGPLKSVVAQEEINDNEEGSTPIPHFLRVCPSSAPSSSSGALTNDIRDSDDIVPEKLLKPTAFVDKLYRIINIPESANYVTWTESGASFIIWGANQFTEYLGSSFPDSNFSSFMDQLTMYGFHRINLIHHSTEDQTWEISHPKFIRGRSDLLHEIKLKLHWCPATKDETESVGDAPAQLDTIRNEDMRMRDNPSKIINKYLLEQVPYARIALTHDRDWSYVAKMGCSYLDPSRLIEEVTFLNDITVDIELGIVFLEPKDKISPLTVEERAIIDQIEGHHITIEQYLFGSNGNHSTLLFHLVNQLRSDYMPPRPHYAVPAKPLFLTGHPKRLLSLDDLVDIRRNNLKSLLKRHRMRSIRSELNALPLHHSNRGTCLLRLADALSRRFWRLNQLHDLDEAISCYKELVSLLPQTHYHFLEAILGLCSSVYQRFQLLGNPDDIRELLEHLNTEHNLHLESLLAPVKTQLQERPQQLINKFSDSKVSNQATMDEGLNAPVAPRSIDEDKSEVKDRTSGSSRQKKKGGRGSKGSAKVLTTPFGQSGRVAVKDGKFNQVDGRYERSDYSQHTINIGRNNIIGNPFHNVNNSSHQTIYYGQYARSNHHSSRSAIGQVATTDTGAMNNHALQVNESHELIYGTNTPQSQALVQGGENLMHNSSFTMGMKSPGHHPYRQPGDIRPMMAAEIEFMNRQMSSMSQEMDAKFGVQGGNQHFSSEDEIPAGMRSPYFTRDFQRLSIDERVSPSARFSPAHALSPYNLKAEESPSYLIEGNPIEVNNSRHEYNSKLT